LTAVLSEESALARQLRVATPGSTATLIVLVLVWRLSGGVSIGEIVLVAILTLPLGIALPRLRSGHRRTYAWATLAVIPSLVLALTEVIANAAARSWAAACLFLAFVVFVMLIAYLRASRSG
jgi:uncharacterized membrane protein